MALAFDADQDRRFARSAPAPRERSLAPRAGGAPEPNTIRASQARAARRREAMSHEQAVSAWLRELSGRAR